MPSMRRSDLTSDGDPYGVLKLIDSENPTAVMLALVAPCGMPLSAGMMRFATEQHTSASLSAYYAP